MADCEIARDSPGRQPQVLPDGPENSFRQAPRGFFFGVIKGVERELI